MKSSVLFLSAAIFLCSSDSNNNNYNNKTKLLIILSVKCVELIRENQEREKSERERKCRKLHNQISLSLCLSLF